MSQPDPRDVEREFLHTAPMDDGACEAYLAGIEPAVARAVRGLRSALRSGMDGSGGGDLEALVPPGSTPTIPGFVELEHIGSGGHGDVYRARQVELGRTVALKVLRFATEPSAMGRFLQEAQALAALRHANIVQLFDARLSSEAAPYLVLEYVDGKSLLEHCDEHRLDLPARIELFVEVCDAVQHAHDHGSGILHRDLKPENILVTEEGVPKLLDFGIARWLGGERDFATGAHQFIGTSEYASPEALAQGEASVASDVYSLGAVLYELLTGHLPHGCQERGAINPAGFAELAKTVSESSPRRAHEVVRLAREARAAKPGAPDATPGVPADELAGRRGRSVAELSRALRGDLDTVLRQALDLDPRRRFRDVRRLAEDLRRYLRDEPVVASELGVGPRARRFVSRHRGACTLAATGLAIVLVWGWTMWQSKRETQDALERLEGMAGVASQATFDLVGLMDREFPHSTNRRLRNLRRRMLEAALPRLVDLTRESALVGTWAQPALAEAHLRIATLAQEVGTDDEVRVNAEEALRHSREPDPAWTESERGALRSRAELLLGRLEQDRGAYTEAQGHYVRALDEAISGNSIDAEIEALDQLANIGAKPDPVDDGRSYRSIWVERIEAKLSVELEPRERVLLASELAANLARQAIDEDDPKRAIELLEPHREPLEDLATATPDDPEVALHWLRVVRHQGDAQISLGDWDDAVVSPVRARAFAERYLEADPEFIAIEVELTAVLSWIGFAHFQAQRVEEAAEAYALAKERRERTSAARPDNLPQLRTYGDSVATEAMVFMGLGDQAKAADALEESVALAELRWELDPDSLDAPLTIAQFLEVAAGIRLGMGEREKALGQYARAIEMHGVIETQAPRVAESMEMDRRRLERSLAYAECDLERTLELDLEAATTHRELDAEGVEEIYLRVAAIFQAALTAWEAERPEIAAPHFDEALAEIEALVALPGGDAFGIRQTRASISVKAGVFFATRGLDEARRQQCVEAVARAEEFLMNDEIAEFRSRLIELLAESPGPAIPIEAGAPEDEDSDR